MTEPHLLTILRPLCHQVDEEVLRDFLSRMDPEYFERFQPDDIARHVLLIGRLDPAHPCQVRISKPKDGLYDLAVVAYDYFSEFATMCGLLSAFGLDIREGSIYTFKEAHPAAPSVSHPALRRGGPVRRRTGFTRKKIVDCFLVRPLFKATWSPGEQRRFVEELTALMQLLEQRQFQEARHRVNRRLVEVLARERRTFAGLLHPVQICFAHERSSRETIMDIRSTDTPAFLYAFANALAMRGVYIHKAHIEHVGPELHDRLYVRDRHGQAITRKTEQEELRLTATLIKQFTQCLTWAPDPAKAIGHFDQFLDALLADTRGERALTFLKDKKILNVLARLLGTSDFLWEEFLRRQHANLLPMLDTYRHVPLRKSHTDLARELRKRVAAARTDEQRRSVLNQFKDREMFRIDMKHLLDQRRALPEFSEALTDLAEVVVEQAVRDCQGKMSARHGVPRTTGDQPCPFAVFGMGKFGGRELGYASDIEVLFVYDGAGRTKGKGRRSLDNSEYYERLAQEILQRIEARQEGIFHIDVRLRPHGDKGLLANTLHELHTYYSESGLSAPFERQALIKLRFVAGDRSLGRRVEAHRDRFVYSLQPWDLATALDLRTRQVKELVEPRKTNVKYSPGGLIDVEYAVQYLQLMHGHAHTRLRTPNTLHALRALGQARVLLPEDVAALRAAYLFFRMLIDGLRIVRGHAKDLVLPDTSSEAFVFLARRVGYTSDDWHVGAGKLEADIRRHMATVRDFFDRRFCRS